MLYLESPLNPLLEVVDLPKIIAAGKAAGCGVAVDNTLATPLLQNPLALGADISIHSVTKYLSGHSDLILGSLTTNCLLYTSPSPRDLSTYRMPSSA